MKLDFYTDGAYSSKTKMGGWAAIGVKNDEAYIIDSGYEPYTTNNRMELSGVKRALELITDLYKREGITEATIYTDSAYISNCFLQHWYSKWLNNGWKTSDKRDVINQDLWREILILYIRLQDKIDINISKVQAHVGDTWNTQADLLARKRRKDLEV